MPYWKYSNLKITPRNRFNNRILINSISNTNNNSIQTLDTTVLIPFVVNGINKVTSFLAVQLSDSIKIGIYDGKKYSHFGYEKVDEKPNAKDLAMQCMLFEQKIFKHEIFKITDKNLAKLFSNGRDTTGFFILKKDSVINNSSQYFPNLAIAITICEGGAWAVDYGNISSWNTYNQAHPPLIYVGGNCSTQWFYFQDYVYQIPDYGNGPVLTTGGGSNTTNTPSLYSDADIQPDAWEATDENGFYYSRLEKLSFLLENEAFNVIPCDKLNLLPLDDNGPNGYGIMFKRVAQKEISNSLHTRLDSITNVAPSSTLTPFKIQSINNAYGPVVNCDYFAVHINSLPSNFTAETLLEFFRKNTNSFIDPSLNVSFSAYTDGTFVDSAKFNSSFEESLGSIIHINMLNDGTVIESEYYRSNSPFKCRFTFTTITSPLDYNHPVSGNREFGIFQNPGNNGYTFYTMGVDRTTDWIFGAGNLFNWGFDAADQLWKNVQDKLVTFINNNGGGAVKFAPVIARPKWNQVERYLRGEITFTLLKKLLGC